MYCIVTSTVDTISFSDLFIFLAYALYKLTFDLVASFLFFRRREKKVPFFLCMLPCVTAPFFIQYTTKIHSIPHFFTGSFAVHVEDHLYFTVEDHLRSRDHLGYCNTYYLVNWTFHPERTGCAYTYFLSQDVWVVCQYTIQMPPLAFNSGPF